MSESSERLNWSSSISIGTLVSLGVGLPATALLWNWVDQLVKATGPAVYFAFFLPQFWVYVVSLARWNPNSTSKNAYIGAFAVGLIAGLISLLMTTMFIPDPIYRIANSVTKTGALTFWSVHVLVAFLLGGWAFTMMALAVHRLVARSIASRGREKSI
jgi:hypothetical protein